MAFLIIFRMSIVFIPYFSRILIVFIPIFFRKLNYIVVPNRPSLMHQNECIKFNKSRHRHIQITNGVYVNELWTGEQENCDTGTVQQVSEITMKSPRGKRGINAMTTRRHKFKNMIKSSLLTKNHDRQLGNHTKGDTGTGHWYYKGSTLNEQKILARSPS